MRSEASFHLFFRIKSNNGRYSEPVMSRKFTKTPLWLFPVQNWVISVQKWAKQLFPARIWCISTQESVDGGSRPYFLHKLVYNSVIPSVLQWTQPCLGRTVPTGYRTRWTRATGTSRAVLLRRRSGGLEHTEETGRCIQENPGNTMDTPPHKNVSFRCEYKFSRIHVSELFFNANW